MPSHRTTARLLLILEVVMGVAAVAGSWIPLAHTGGTEGLSANLLEGSPFSSYLVPGIALLIMIGGAYLSGAYLVYMNYRWAGWISASLGLELVGWIVVQVMIIGPLSILQPICAIWGIAVWVLGVRLAITDPRRTAPVRRPAQGTPRGTSAR